MYSNDDSRTGEYELFVGQGSLSQSQILDTQYQRRHGDITDGAESARQTTDVCLDPGNTYTVYVEGDSDTDTTQDFDGADDPTPVTGDGTDDTDMADPYVYDTYKTNDPSSNLGADDDGGEGYDTSYEFTLSSPPTADASNGFSGTTSIVEGETSISFDGSASSDPDGDSLSYTWTFEDGSSGSGETTSYDYSGAVTTNGGSSTFSPDLTVDDGSTLSQTDTDSNFASITVYNDFDGDGLADDDSATGVSTDDDNDDDGIPDANDPAPYNVYPSASDSSSESTDEDNTLTVNNGESADLTELATDGYKSYDHNTDTISIEQVDEGSFSAGSTVTLGSGATVTVESDGSWTYDPNGEYDSLGSGETATDEFNYTVSDDPHSGTAAATEQGTVSITISGVNDAPTAPSDDNSTTNEVAEDAVTGTSVGVDASSTDADGDTLSYSLNNPSGAFTIDSTTGEVSIDDASKIDYEAASSPTITVAANDGTTSTTTDFTIAVTDVEETPTFINSGPGSVAEDATGATAHDVDASVDTTASDSPDAGVSYTFTTGNGDSAYAIDSSTGEITVADAGKLNYENSTSRTVTVEASEGGQNSTQDITLDVTDTDESPSFTSGTSDTVVENATDGDSVHDVQATVGGASDEEVSYVISGGNGDSAYAIDSTTGEITVADTTQLDHEVSSSRTLTVEASEGSAANTRDINIAVTDVNETPTFTSAASNAVAEDKTNDATVHDVEADVHAHGSKESDTGVTYTITGGNVDSAFTIDSSTGEVTVDNASAVETELRTGENITLTVEATEGQQAQTQTVTVDINQVDEVPTFTSGASASVAEDAFSDVLVRDVQANVGGDSDEDVTYAITGGNSAGLFKVDSTSGELTVDNFNSLDHEDVASVTLTVEAREGTESDTQDLTIDITDVDEEPDIFAKSPPTVAEDTASGTQIHDIDATVDDADQTLDTGVTYTIVGGNTDSAFAIDSSTGELTVDNASAVETELHSDLTVTVEAAEGVESDTQDITVDISQVDEVPAFTSGTTAAVAENATNGTAVTDVEADVGGAADEDVNYVFTGGNGDNAYVINSSSGQITVSNATELDHEVSDTRTVTVQASEGTATKTQNLDIDVTDVDERPSFSSGTTATVTESDTGSTDVLDINATVGGDDDEGVSYAIAAGNDDVAGNGGEAFAIDSSGQISISDTADIDESRQSSFSLTVEASEGTATNTQTVTVTVTDDVVPTFQPGSSTPADDATAHLPSDDLGLEFDENVTLGSGKIKLVDDGDGSSSETFAVSAESVTISTLSNSTLNVSPSGVLESDTNYHIEVDSGAIEDAFGNAYSGFSDSTTFDFQTANTTPTFTSSNPTVTIDEDGSGNLTSVLDVRDVSRSDNLTWTVLSTPSNGSLAGVDNETRSVSGVSSPHALSTAPTYTPDPDFHDGGTPDDSFNVNVADDVPGTNDTITVDVAVTALNDAPSIVVGGDQTVRNDTTRQTVANFTNSFDPGGGSDENTQRISDFSVSSDNNSLFAAQPDINNDGNLTFTPADSVQGTATVDVQVVDDGGTANGGTDTSVPSQFNITVDNRAPSITDFSASNPSNQEVRVSFESDEQLSTVEVSLSGAGSATLTEDDFSDTGSINSTYTYEATYDVSSDGSYTAKLNAAVDDAGVGSESGMSSTVFINTDTGGGSSAVDDTDQANESQQSGQGDQDGQAEQDSPDSQAEQDSPDSQAEQDSPDSQDSQDSQENQAGQDERGSQDGQDSQVEQDSRDARDGGTQEPSGETSEDEEWVEPSEISEVEIVDVRLETAPANSVNTTSVVVLENPSTEDRTVDVRFSINGEVVEERAVVIPADERIHATHSEVVEEAGTHEVAANLATEEDGETVRTFDFTIGTVELDESGEEVASSSAEPPSGPDQVDATDGQQSDDGGANLPVVLLGLVAVIAAISGTLYWQRHSE